MGEEDQTTTQTLTADALGSLLETYTKKAAEKAAEEELKKGFVTREQINAALSQLGTDLETHVADKINAGLGDLVESAVKKAITVDPSGRKSTVGGAQATQDEFEADPVSYIIRKGREQGPESFTDTEKRVIWAVTLKALSTGMIEDQSEEE
jgi:hypothetical protein